MSWEEVAKEMKGMEGVISMMDKEVDADEEGEDDNDNKGKKDEDGNDNKEEEEEDDKTDKKCDEDDRGAKATNNTGLQSLLLSEILQFRTSRLRSVKMGDEKDGGGQSLMESESFVENLDDKEGTLTDISLFTSDSGQEARSDNMISIQVSHFFKVCF